MQSARFTQPARLTGQPCEHAANRADTHRKRLVSRVWLPSASVGPENDGNVNLLRQATVLEDSRMNRALILGIAIFFAVVGIALVGGESKAVAGHGCHGCAGDCGGGCDCGGGFDCCGCHGRRHHRRHRRHRCCGCDGPPACCGVEQCAPTCACPAPAAVECAPPCAQLVLVAPDFDRSARWTRGRACSPPPPPAGTQGARKINRFPVVSARA